MQTFCRTLLSVLLLALPAVAQAQFAYTNNYGIWYYTTTNGTITITKYTGPGSAVTIPDRIPATTNGLPVTSIGNGALEHITNLTSVTIPNSVTSIGRLAFALCNGLTNLTIGNNVTSIGYEAFAACSSLTAISVDTNNPVFSSLDGVLFNHSQTILVAYPGGIAGDYTIPDSVTSIGDAAFNSCSRLATMTIGTNVTSIGSYAFLNCSRLSEIYFNGNAPSVGQYCFGFGRTIQCDPATAYYLPGTTGWSEFSTNSFLPVVQWNPLVLFNYTTNNGAITITGYHGSSDVVAIPSTCNGLPVTSIGVYAFLMHYSLTSVTIPNSVTNIGNYAFAWCWSLTNATIPDRVTSIGYDAFFECYSLTSITIPSSVTSIGADAFASCWDLTNVTIGSGVTNIGYNAFSGCARLSSVTIGNSVTSIGNGAFYGCASLTSITIPNSVTSIEGWAFGDCTSLTAITVDTNNPVYSSVDGVLFNKSQTTLTQYPAGKAGDYTIPNSVTSIGDNAFSYCVSLTGITIPTSVTNIGAHAFSSCTSISSITIPSSVTGIGGWAFASCTRLRSINVDASNVVYSSEHGVLFNKSQSTLIEYPGGKAGGYTIPDSVISIGEGAFYDCSSLGSVTIPNGVTDIGAYAFTSCTNMTSITIGYSVIGIGDRAFWNCTNLTGLYFQGNAPLLGGTNVFIGANSATVYYLPGTTGWGPTFGDRPTALWFLPNPLVLNNIPSFGVKTNRFGFIISWATNIPVVVEASTTLANPTWSPISTNTLSSGSSYFSDPQWKNYPGRFYRLRSP
jgi:hypothetical protein